MNFINSNKKLPGNNIPLFWPLVAIGIILFIGYQLDINPREDDEYLGEQVYWLLKQGKVRSELGYSDLGYDVYQSIFHKLFIYSGYILSCIWGWSLSTLRIVPLACTLMFFASYLYYIKVKYQHIHNLHFWAVALLLIFNQDLLYAAMTFRPETMLMFLGFVAYACLEAYLQKRRFVFLFCAACCSGLAMFAHLNGIIFIAAGIVLLLCKQQFKTALLFGIIAAIAFVPYFADVLYHADIAYFKNQFFKDPVVRGEGNNVVKYLISLCNEQTRFLFNEKQIIFTLSIATVLIFAFKKLKQSHGDLLRYTLVLVIGLGIVCPSKSTKYLVIYLPFLSIILIEGWLYAEQLKLKVPTMIIRSLITIYILISTAYSLVQVKNNFENISNGGLIKEHKTITDKIPGQHKNIPLLAPRIMVYNELGHFKNLRDIYMVDVNNMESLLRSAEYQYVIFSARDRAYFNLDALAKDTTLIQILDSTQHYTLVQAGELK